MRRGQRESEKKEGKVKRNEPVGLLNRLLDSLDVQRTDTPHVDNLNLDALLLLQDLSSLKSESNHSRVPNNSDILS